MGKELELEDDNLNALDVVDNAENEPKEESVEAISGEEISDNDLNDIASMLVDGKPVLSDEDDSRDEDDDGETEEGKPEWYKTVRQQNRELKRKLKDAERQLKRSAQAGDQEKVVEAEELGPRPELFDFDGDTDAFSEAHELWLLKKIEIDKKKEDAKKAEEQKQAAWSQKLASYNQKKERVVKNLPEYADAEEEVHAIVGVNGLGAIIDLCDKPEAVVFALSKKPEKMQAFKKLLQENPIAFSYHLAKFESTISYGESRSSTTKQPPQPHSRIKSESGSKMGDELARLQEEAIKTGDWSKYFAAKHKNR